LANFFSKRSRIITGTNDEKFLGEEKEWLVVYTKDKLKEEYFDFFVFGHRHLPIDFQLNEQSRYINLGDWIKYNSYAEFDGEQLLLKYHQ
jgi:UDP-2,3-diacylglucosamine hydrolase